MVKCTTCRSVLPANPGAGGRFLGSTNCGEQAQVPTHRGAETVLPCAPHSSAAAAATPTTPSHLQTPLPAMEGYLSYRVVALGSMAQTITWPLRRKKRLPGEF